MTLLKSMCCQYVVFAADPRVVLASARHSFWQSVPKLLLD